MSNKTLPFSEEAEKGFLGACLLNASEVLPQAYDKNLENSDFYTPAHSLIWQAIQTISEHGLPVDAITVSDQLKKTKELDKAGGERYLDDLIDTCFTASHAGAYLKVLKEKAQLRNIWRACQEAMQTVMEDGEDDPEEILNKAQEGLFRCSRVTENVLTHGEAANLLITRFKDAKKGIKPGLPCFMEDAESFLGCFKYAGLYFGASEPGLGKTTWLQLQLKHWAKAGYPVAGVSFEMRLEDFFGRILCEEADVSMFAMEQGHSEFPTETPRLTKFVGACKQWINEDGDANYPLYLTDKRMNVVELCSWIRMMHKRHGIKAVGIDYLQLIHAGTSKKLNGENAEMAYVVDMLRDLAKELNIVIIVMAQFDKMSRQVVRGAASKMPKQRPTPSAIRGSSVIEDAAWGIFMMYMWENEDTGQDDLVWDLNKHRSGNRGRVRLNFIRNRQRMLSDGVLD